MGDVIVRPPPFQTATYGGTGPGGGAAAATQEGLNRLGGTWQAQDEQAKAGRQANALGQAAQNRTPAEQNTYDAQNAAGGANGNQAGAIELARRQAMGQGPSAGALSLQQGLNQASAQQSALAAGARGSAGLATAGANRLANTSNLQQNAFSAAGALRAQDMAQGRGMYNSLTAQQRDQAGQLQGEANAFGMQNQSMNDQHALAMGNAAVGFGGVANGYNGEAFNQATGAYEPTNAQDDANQATREAMAGWNKKAAADNTEENA